MRLKEMTSRHISQSQKAVLGIFFISGFLFSSWIPHIPLIQEKLSLTEGRLGLALLGIALGSILFMPLSGLLTDRWGSRRITVIAGVLCALSLPLPILSPNFITLMSSLFLFGSSMGVMDVAMNAQAVWVEKKIAKPVMSSFHGFFSLGGLFGSATAGIALSAGVTQVSHVLTVTLLAVICVIYICSFFQNDSNSNTQKEQAFALPHGALWGLGALAFIVLIAEGAIADWSAVYITKTFSSDVGTAAAGYAAFSLMMAIGRLTGDRMVQKCGPPRIVQFTSIMAAVGLGLALLVQSPYVAIAGFGLVGLGLSNLVPVLFSAAGHQNPDSAGKGLAAVATLGYFGFLVGPPMIGLLADLSSLRIALGMVAALIFGISFFSKLVRS